MFAWAGDRQVPGGLYRIRPQRQADAPADRVPRHQGRPALTFTDPLAAESVADVKNFGLKVWDLKRSANYWVAAPERACPEGVGGVPLADRKTLTLTVPGLGPTRGLELWYW